jgi:hypothetical protein
MWKFHFAGLFKLGHLRSPEASVLIPLPQRQPASGTIPVNISNHSHHIGAPIDVAGGRTLPVR